MASLFDEELERQRRQLEEVGVNQAMVDAAGLLPVASEPPKHWMEQARERDGNGKFFGKMLLGGMTGMMPFVFPEAIGGNARYKAELEQHYDAQERLRELQVLSGIDMTNPSIADIELLPDDLQGYAADVYRGNQGGYLAEQARLAGMSYADFMALSPEMRRWHIRKNASAVDRADMDFVAGRQTPEQKAEEAGLVAAATEQAKADVAAAQTEESRMPQIQDAFDITMQLLDDNSFRGLYGAVDGRTPTVLPESLNAKAKLSRLSDILYMFARGELKGQGQVTEQEAEAARNAASTINNFLQGDDQAADELMRLNKKFGEILGIEPENFWKPRDERATDRRWRVVTDGTN